MSAQLIPLEAEKLGESIIASLERALEFAREGRLSSVAIALVYRDGCVGSLRSETPNWALMAGSLATLQHELIEEKTS